MKTKAFLIILFLFFGVKSFSQNTVTTLQPIVTLDTNAVCAGSVIDVPFFSTGGYLLNTYIAQLSDASGNFTNLTVLGSRISDITYDPASPTPGNPPPGYIEGLIPDTISPGCNYYIRVIATGPTTPPAPAIGSSWGPFCIQRCDIITNNEQDISLCVIPTTDTACIDINVNINFYNSTAVYSAGNQFQVQLISRGPFPPPMTEIGPTGVLGTINAVNDTTLRLCAGPLSAMIANNIYPGNYYLRIIATNSSIPENSLGSIVRFKWGAPLDIVPVLSVTNYLTGAPVTHACKNDIVRYTVTNANPNSQYVWTGPFVGSPLTSSGQFLVQFGASINFTLNVKENNFGCLGPDTTITLPVFAEPNINIIGPSTVCVGDTAIYQTIFQSSTFFLWSVSNPHGHIADTIINQAQITFDSAGTYQISVYVSNLCFDSIGFKTITVLPYPQQPSVIQSGDTLTSSVAATTYRWYKNSVLQPGFTTQTIIITPPADNGFWQVEISNNPYCKIISQGYLIDVGINELMSENISIFPNPAGKELRIKNAELKIESIEIFDALGMKCLTPTLSKGEGVSVDVSLLASGIYFIKLKSESKEITAKFVKH